MPLIPFPNVPSYPGVPQLPSAVPVPNIPLLRSDSPEVSEVTTPPRWGIFLGARAVVEPDSFVSLEYFKEYNVASFPVERGSFANYNKVALPYEQRVTMSKGGTDSERERFIKSIEDAAASLDLYTVVTPGRVYVNANVTRINYSRRSQQGVSLIVAELGVQEIRVAGDLTFKNTADPSGAALQDGGPVQTTEPTAAQQAAIEGGIQ